MIRKRKKIRLPKRDYRQAGIYFVTICTDHHACILCGPRVSGDAQSPSANMADSAAVPSSALPTGFVLSEVGRAVEKAIHAIHLHYPGVSVDRYVIMPNHIHLLIRISDVSASGRTANSPDSLENPGSSPSLSDIVRHMKGAVTRQAGFHLWQKSFHDHIVRDAQDYRRICAYIDQNPQKWTEDCYYIPF